MSDNLRDRIAKILYSQNTDQGWNGKEITWDEISQAYRACWLHDADAVIQALPDYLWRCPKCNKGEDRN